MKNLHNYIQSRCALSQTDSRLVETYFTTENVPANTLLLEAGKTERYVYFLSEGIVKGYENVDGKIVVQHLVAEHDFFTSLESFMTETPAPDYYETVTDCKLLKISKPDFELIQAQSTFWSDFIKTVTNEHLNCKIERVKDFQVLTAKERYLKFITQQPNLALNISIDNIASFLGMEPQSLSRIRKQITI